MPSALLFNCSQPEVMEDAVKISANHFAEFGRPITIGVYANAFLMKNDSYKGANQDLNSIRKDITPEAYANFAKNWINAGAEIVGGYLWYHTRTYPIIEKQWMISG